MDIELEEKEEIGQIFRAKRKKRKLTLRQVAQRVGISTSYLSKIERGIAWKPAERVLYGVAAVLGIDKSLVDEAKQRNAFDPVAFEQTFPLVTSVVYGALAKLEFSDVRYTALGEIERRFAFFGDSTEDVASDLALFLAGKLKADDEPKYGVRPLSHYWRPMDEEVTKRMLEVRKERQEQC